VKDAALVIMAKDPESGKVKTRLGLGGRDASDLSIAFLKDLAWLHLGRSYDVILAVHPPERERALGKLLGITRTMGQEGRDLGERMGGVVRTALTGYRRVVIVGSDLPTLEASRVEEAFRALEISDLVIGPCVDGGYYLLAMSRELPLFEGMPWSTPEVFAKTMARAECDALAVHVLPEERDVDTPRDLAELARTSNPSLAPETCRVLRRLFGTSIRTGSAKAPVLARRISVVIPALNEERGIADALHALPPDVERIVVDGGSTDKTVSSAKSGAVVIHAPRGRALQQNAGAREAKGDVLLFLHADTRLPKEGFREITRALDQGYVGGAFLGRFDSDHLLFRFAYPIRDLRARIFLEIYGDQGIFVRKDVFDELGGFPNQPIMEDYEFVQRVRKRGPFKVIPYPITMSARRYLRYGIIRQTLKNWWILYRYLCGTDTNELYRSYERFFGRPDKATRLPAKEDAWVKETER
jgi:rSAM/selenodomain-associated transferase 2/rSAM/selenodomain-associated transferase 1